MTSIITNEIEERYPYPDNGERPTGITRLGQCLASRKAYRAGVCRKITDREIDAAALAVYALSADGAIRKCMRRVAMMCARHSACERLDRQEARG